jgi:hypothetical protein
MRIALLALLLSAVPVYAQPMQIYASKDELMQPPGDVLPDICEYIAEVYQNTLEARQHGVDKEAILTLARRIDNALYAAITVDIVEQVYKLSDMEKTDPKAYGLAARAYCEADKAVPA